MTNTKDKEFKWCGKSMSEIDNQYLSNIVWFIDIFWASQYYRHNTYFKLNIELSNRKMVRLPFKPLPIKDEIEHMLRMNMIKTNGDIIGNKNCGVLNGEVIGSITHLENWKNYIDESGRDAIEDLSHYDQLFGFISKPNIQPKNK